MLAHTVDPARCRRAQGQAHTAVFRAENVALQDRSIPLPDRRSSRGGRRVESRDKRTARQDKGRAAALSGGALSYILDGLAVHGKEDIGHAHGVCGRRVAERVAQVHDFEDLMRTQDVNLEPDTKHALAADSALLHERMHRYIVLPQQRASGPPQRRPRVCAPPPWFWHGWRCARCPTPLRCPGDSVFLIGFVVFDIC